MIAVPKQNTHEDRRDDVVVGVVKEMREWLTHHEREESMKFDTIREEIAEARKDSEERHEDLVARMEHMSTSTLSVVSEQNRALQEIHSLFKKAFPEGDAEKHRQAHENWITKDREDHEFWSKLKQHVVNWATVAIIGWGGIILWAAFLKGPK